MNRSRKSVAEILALRGTRQMSMIHIESLDEAAAAARAGIDLLSIEDPIWSSASGSRHLPSSPTMSTTARIPAPNTTSASPTTSSIRSYLGSPELLPS